MMFNWKIYGEDQVFENIEVKRLWRSEMIPLMLYQYVEKNKMFQVPLAFLMRVGSDCAIWMHVFFFYSILYTLYRYFSWFVTYRESVYKSLLLTILYVMSTPKILLCWSLCQIQLRVSSNLEISCAVCLWCIIKSKN